MNIIIKFLSLILIVLFLIIALPSFANPLFISFSGSPLFVKGKVYESAFDDGISIGDKFLFSFYPSELYQNEYIQDIRKKINKNFKNNDNKKARENLLLYIQKLGEKTKNYIKPIDPEALIYLNNACAAISNKPAYTIAAVIPKSGSDNSRQILQGIAQGVNDVNGGYNFGDPTKSFCETSLNNDINIKVVIAYQDSTIKRKDRNDAIKLQTKILIQHPDVLAVIGYSTSDDAEIAISKASDKNFKNSQLSLILPTATENPLINSRDREFVFRIVPNNSLIAESIVIEIASKTKSIQLKNKLAILYNAQFDRSGSNYSLELANIIKDKLVEKGLLDKEEEIYFLNIGDDNIVITNFTTKIKQGDITVLVIIPDSNANEDNHSKKNTIKILKEISNIDIITKNEVLIFAADAFYNLIDYLKKEKLLDKVPQIYVALPWDIIEYSKSIQDNNNDNISQDNKNLWGDGVGWRYAFSNDSVVALEKVFKNMQLARQKNWWTQLNFNKSVDELRKQVREEILNLANSEKIPKGKTGSISFTNNERTEEEIDIKIIPARR